MTYREPEPPTGLGRRLLWWLFLAAVPTAMAAATIVFAQPYTVRETGMWPSLNAGDRVLVNRVAFRARAPRTGDVVVFSLTEEGFQGTVIKRVIATAGQTVAIDDSQVFVDGRPLKEEYSSRETIDDVEMLTVPPGTVYVLGDNRALSEDSRDFGPVDVTALEGHAYMVALPLKLRQDQRRPL